MLKNVIYKFNNTLKIGAFCNENKNYFYYVFPVAKNSNLAVEALAGLASKEDFTAVTLKKSSDEPVGTLLPFKDLMLLQVKGRRHVQTRLLEPVANKVNQGDSFVLVTPTAVSPPVIYYCNLKYSISLFCKFLATRYVTFYDK